MCLHPNSPLHSVDSRAWRLGCFPRLPSPSCTPGLGGSLAALAGGSDDLGIWVPSPSIGGRNRRPGEARHQFSLSTLPIIRALPREHRLVFLSSIRAEF